MERYQLLWEKLGVKGNVINLRGREDRALSAKQGAELIGLPLQFHTFDRHPDGGTAGCFDSHQKVCRKILESGQKFGLILEDDFGPTVELLTDEGYKALKEAINFILTSKDWSIVYFGVLPNIWFEKSVRTGKHLYKMKPWACTHAMVLSESYMKKVINWSFGGTGKDAYDWRHRKCESAYAFHPQAFKQIESSSDIRSNQMQVSGPIRDLPVNLASWYALNIGASLGQTLCVFGVIVATMSMTSSDNHYKTLAKRSLLQK
jgi:hypothetical protein